jgi:hypothetical protein
LGSGFGAGLGFGFGSGLGFGSVLGLGSGLGFGSGLGSGFGAGLGLGAGLGGGGVSFRAAVRAGLAAGAGAEAGRDVVSARKAFAARGFLAAASLRGRLRFEALPSGRFEPRSRSHRSSSVSFAAGALARPDEVARGWAVRFFRRGFAPDLAAAAFGVSLVIAASRVETLRRRRSSSPGVPVGGPSLGEITTASAVDARVKQAQIATAAHPIRVANRLPTP